MPEAIAQKLERYFAWYQCLANARFATADVRCSDIAEHPWALLAVNFRNTAIEDTAEAQEVLTAEA